LGRALEGIEGGKSQLHVTTVRLFYSQSNGITTEHLLDTRMAADLFVEKQQPRHATTSCTNAGAVGYVQHGTEMKGGGLKSLKR
jgi:hypothetical protein